MAERRMFARKIVDSDQFLEMPLSAQALYFHLNIRADDDGFVNNPKRITDYISASADDLKLLLAKRFVIGFESGVIVIRHWRIHNTIKSDRYHLTDYQEELARLLIEPSKAYSEAPLPTWAGQAEMLEPNWNHSGTNLEPEISIGKYRLDLEKDRKERVEDRGVGEGDSPVSGKTALLSEQSGAAAPTPAGDIFSDTARHKYGTYGWVRLSDEEYDRLLTDLGEVELERCIAYVDESAQSTGNKNGWKDWNLVIRKCSRDCWGLRQRGGQHQSGSASAMDDLQQLHQMYASEEYQSN